MTEKVLFLSHFTIVKLSLYPSVWVSICLKSINLSDYQSDVQFVCLSNHLDYFPLVLESIGLSINLSIQQSSCLIYPSVCLINCQSIHQFIFLSIYRYISVNSPVYLIHLYVCLVPIHVYIYLSIKEGCLSW